MCGISIDMFIVAVIVSARLQSGPAAFQSFTRLIVFLISYLVRLSVDIQFHFFRLDNWDIIWTGNVFTLIFFNLSKSSDWLFGVLEQQMMHEQYFF